MINGFTLQNIYQMGFVVRDVDEAMDYFRDRFGVQNFRLKRHNEDIATAHCYIGDMMYELVQVSDKGPEYFVAHRPTDQVAQFHHHAYAITSEEDFAALSKAIKDSGLKYWQSSSMNGGMNVFFVDMRADTGLYHEFVYRKGEALDYYDTVPRNDPQ